MDVFKDYSFGDIEKLFTSTLNDGYVFLDSDIGKKEITLTIDKQVIKYYVTISEE